VFSQRLAVLAFQVGDLVDLANEPDDKFREQAGRVRSAIEQLSGHIYEMARRLHPKILDDLGLAAALRELCDAFGDIHRIDVSFSSPEEMPLLDPKRALCLYGVAQEAMTNVARHAWASRLKVALTIVDGRSVLRISDDGIGFDVEERLTTGPGLAGMKERVESLGGQLDITSDPGRGTTVEARVSTEGYPP
jgi:signal transduction histidine kinase